MARRSISASPTGGSGWRRQPGPHEPRAVRAPLSPPPAPSTDLLALHRANPPRYPYLLDNVARGTPQARYDILFAFPEATLEAAPGAAAGRFLERFDAWWRDEGAPESEGDPAGAVPPHPFLGGWFLYLGYELAAEVEPLLALLEEGGAFPRAFATRVPAALVRDHERSEIHLLAEAGRGSLIERMAADLEEAAHASSPPGPPPGPPSTEAGSGVLSAPLREEDPGRYLEGVRRVLDYVRAGSSGCWRGKDDPGQRGGNGPCRRARSGAPVRRRPVRDDRRASGPAGVLGTAPAPPGGRLPAPRNSAARSADPRARGARAVCLRFARRSQGRGDAGDGRARLGLNPGLAGLKHLNRLEQVLGRAEWEEAEIAEGLMLDVRGLVIEGTRSNLLLVKEGTLITPGLEESGVAGIVREIVLEIAAEWGIPTEIREVRPEELADADEAFLTNSIIRLWPIRRIEETEVARGAVAEAMALRNEELAR